MRTFVIAVCLAVLPTAAGANHIGLYDVPNGSVCLTLALPFVITSVYVVHKYTLGATGSRYKISDTSGFLHLAIDYGSNLFVGNPYTTGVEVAYGGCFTLEINVCRLGFLNPTSGSAPGCYHLLVEPYPGDPNVVVADCSFAFRPATGGYFSFNNVGCDDCTIAVESATWGAVKALYR